MTSTFEVGDRVLVTALDYREARHGTVTAVSSIGYDTWPVTVRLDSGVEEVYRHDELAQASQPIDSLDVYQRMTQDTAVYPGQGTFGGAMYATMALNEEAGEVAGKVAKFIRKSSGWDALLAYGNGSDFYNELYPEELVLAVSKELGDVLYQVARVAEEFGLTLSDVATVNIERLADRKKRDVIIGEGDDR